MSLAWRKPRRRKNWFKDERPKERKWILHLGIILLGGYALFMSGNEVYRMAAEDGYDKGRLRGYEVGLQRGKASITCPQPWQTTMAAPLIIN